MGINGDGVCIGRCLALDDFTKTLYGLHVDADLGESGDSYFVGFVVRCDILQNGLDTKDSISTRYARLHSL